MKLIQNIKKFIGLVNKSDKMESMGKSIMAPDIDLSTRDENKCIELLSKALKTNRNDAVLFGAVAMGVYGYQRNTLDIDFMLPEKDFENFKSILEAIGYKKILQTVQYAKFRHKNEAFMDIDTVFIAENTADEIKKLAEEKNIGEENSFLCASLETLLATKLHAVKYNNENRGGKDVIDIKMLIKANKIDITGEWFKVLCVKYGGQDVYNKFFSNDEGGE
jgi:hypothetical protein